jgi:hypothetical protein
MTNLTISKFINRIFKNSKIEKHFPRPRSENDIRFKNIDEFLSYINSNRKYLYYGIKGFCPMCDSHISSEDWVIKTENSCVELRHYYEKPFMIYIKNKGGVTDAEINFIEMELNKLKINYKNP